MHTKGGGHQLIRPSLVEQAMTLADRLGFENSCLDEVGEFLHVLVGHLQTGKIAEFGTGCGVSTAWMASATELDIYTVDNDASKSTGIKDLFSDVAHVHPIIGDWEQILANGPFQFVFVDAKPAKLDGVDRIVDMTDRGGLIVLDDLTPVEFWPEDWKGRPDRIRDVWLHHPKLAAVEMRTSMKASVILARRMR